MHKCLLTKGIPLGVLLMLITTSGVPQIIGTNVQCADEKNIVMGDSNRTTLDAKYDSPNHHIIAANFNYFIPPYNSSGGGKDHGGSGLGSHHDAEWDANHRFGELFTKAESCAEGLDTMAYAQSQAWITGPAEGTLKTEKSGNQIMVMFFLLNGAASTTTEGTFTEAESQMNLSGSLIDLDTNETVGSLTRTLYRGLSEHKRWLLKLCILIFPVTLSTNHSYYFKAQLSIQHNANSDKLFGSADAHSSLNAILFFVLLIESQTA